MILHKINATDSTNTYLKSLLKKNTLENYTVVSTDFQFSGKGQGVNKWISEKGKNLLFSILITPYNLSITNSAYLNFAISLGIYKVLVQYSTQIKIKWPNDIMADSHKICGILIENKLKGRLINQSIIGVGLNVNQLTFPENLSKVTSLKKITNKALDRDILLKKLVLSIKNYIDLLDKKQLSILKNKYVEYLYKIGVPTMFQDSNKSFLGKIVGVSKLGMLLIEHTDGSLQEFANKEIAILQVKG